MSAFTGARLGCAVLWAVLVGAALKLLLNEGLARYQLATGETIIEGAMLRFGSLVRWAFLAYLLIWSFFVGSALMSACGVAAHALAPWFDANVDKKVYGIVHSLIAVALVRAGGYRLFEGVMRACIGLMVVVAVATAVVVHPGMGDVLTGLVWPRVPDVSGDGLQWTVALMGGVGGTLTVLCYGYWIREEGREGTRHLRDCRVDLTVGYAMTALFGVAMVIIGARVGRIEGGGATLLVRLADRLAEDLGTLGPAARVVFLVGAWGAVFSSLLGVWQSVPYLFADFHALSTERKVGPIDVTARPYRGFLYALATVPAVGLFMRFETLQKLYAIIGALVIPMLAATLLVLNGTRGPVPVEHRNSRATSLVLVSTLLFFLAAGWFELSGKLVG